MQHGKANISTSQIRLLLLVENSRTDSMASNTRQLLHGNFLGQKASTNLSRMKHGANQLRYFLEALWRIQFPTFSSS